MISQSDHLLKKTIPFQKYMRKQQQVLRTVVRLILYLLATLLIAGMVAYFYFTEPFFVKEPDLRGNLEEASLNYFGHTRTFHTYVPEFLSGNPDLIFVLHGSMSSGLEIRRQMAYEFDRIADEGDAVIVYPDGYEKHWNDCRAAADYAANKRKIDDIVFMQKMEKQLAASMQTQFRHRFAVGLSNGGHLAYKLAMEVPEWITAVAAISANLPAPDNSDCDPKGQPAAVLIMNGTKDPINPYNGGDVSLFGLLASRGNVLPTWETADYWLRLANLDSEPVTKKLENINDRDGSEAYYSIWETPGSLPVVLYTIEGGGHTIPHPRSRLPRLLGKTNRDINGPKEIWKFFMKVAKAKKSKPKE